MQKSKQVRECPQCHAPLKRIIGCQTRMKYWVCTKGGESCYKAPAVGQAS